MSVLFVNLIAVTGSRDAVEALCADARRRVSGEMAKAIGAQVVAWSFEQLFELHPSLADVCGAPPHDAWEYYPMPLGTVRWGRFSRASFRLGIKNYQISSEQANLKLTRGQNKSRLGRPPRLPRQRKVGHVCVAGATGVPS